MKILLRLSRIIDGINGLLGKLIPWLVLAAVLISATNAVARKAFSLSSNAYLVPEREIEFFDTSAIRAASSVAAFLVFAAHYGEWEPYK